MNIKQRKKAYQKAFESQNIPSELAKECSQILINDDSRPRTSAEQEIINKAHRIAFGVSNE
jgi:hypothetical protein